MKRLQLAGIEVAVVSGLYLYASDMVEPLLQLIVNIGSQVSDSVKLCINLASAAVAVRDSEHVADYIIRSTCCYTEDCYHSVGFSGVHAFRPLLMLYNFLVFLLV